MQTENVALAVLRTALALIVLVPTDCRGATLSKRTELSTLEGLRQLAMRPSEPPAARPSDSWLAASGGAHTSSEYREVLNIPTQTLQTPAGEVTIGGRQQVQRQSMRGKANHRFGQVTWNSEAHHTEKCEFTIFHHPETARQLLENPQALLGLQNSRQMTGLALPSPEKVGRAPALLPFDNRPTPPTYSNPQLEAPKPKALHLEELPPSPKASHNGPSRSSFKKNEPIVEEPDSDSEAEEEHETHLPGSNRNGFTPETPFTKPHTQELNNFEHVEQAKNAAVQDNLKTGTRSERVQKTWGKSKTESAKVVDHEETLASHLKEDSAMINLWVFQILVKRRLKMSHEDQEAFLEYYTSNRQIKSALHDEEKFDLRDLCVALVDWQNRIPQEQRALAAQKLSEDLQRFRFGDFLAFVNPDISKTEEKFITKFAKPENPKAIDEKIWTYTDVEKIYNDWEKSKKGVKFHWSMFWEKVKNKLQKIFKSMVTRRKKAEQVSEKDFVMNPLISH